MRWLERLEDRLLLSAAASSALHIQENRLRFDRPAVVVSNVPQSSPATTAASQAAVRPADTILPFLSVANASAVEGDSPDNEVFVVSLSSASSQVVSVQYSTSDITAMAGVDYGGSQGTISFTPGQTSQQIDIPVLNRGVIEPTETFALTLSSPTNAALARSIAIGFIYNDLPPVTVSVADAQATAGGGAPGNMVFVVTLAQYSGRVVTLAYSTADGTAAAGGDYTAESGALTFNPGGPLTQTVDVPILADTLYKPAETFTFTLVPIANATVAVAPAAPPGSLPGVATGTILNSNLPPVLSVAGAMATEGVPVAGFPGGAEVFAVSLSTAGGAATTVNYSTADVPGGAVAGVNYVAASGTLTIPAGQTTGQIIVPILEDHINEPTRTFSLNLSSPVGAILSGGAAAATGTILDNDPEPAMSVADASDVVGSPAGGEEFIVSLSAASGYVVTADYSTQDITAVQGSDYSASFGSISFLPGQTSQQIFVPVIDNTMAGPTKTFSLTLAAPSHATLSAGGATAVGTILNGNPPPALSVADATATEGQSGGDVFVVSLSSAGAAAVTVHYATADGTAKAGKNYTAESGTLTFSPGQTSLPIAVPVIDDGINDPTETFSLTLSAPTNASIARGVATGTILDDDPEPSLSVANATTTEGPPGAGSGSGGGGEVFVVSLSAASGKTVTVHYSTASGTAIAGSDFTATAGTLTFNPGQTSMQITVPVIDDKLNKGTEAFTLSLDSPSNASIAGGGDVATGTILNDYPLPALSVADASATEGVPGGEVFVVSLSTASGRAVTVDYSTADSPGSAKAGTNYTAESGTLTFSPGQVSQQVVVPVLVDPLQVSAKTFTLSLTSPTDATLARATATGTILDIVSPPPPPPALSVGDATTTQGDPGGEIFAVNLSAASSNTVTVQYTTADGTAKAGIDYTATAGTLTFNPGQTSLQIDVPLIPVTVNKDTETFTITLTGPTDATIAVAAATGTILNDIPAPTIIVADATATEGQSGGDVFVVTLSAASGKTVTVHYATANGTASAGKNYTATAGTLTLSPGQTSLQVAVPVIDDGINDPTQTFSLTLATPTNATIARATATGTILDDDPQPSLSVAGASATEGAAGGEVFVVTLSAVSGKTVTVDYSTADGTASAGKNYTAKAGTLTFNPGQTSMQVVVPVVDDGINDPTETFSLTLATPTNATLARATATGTILDDDPQPSLSVAGASATEGAAGGEVFIVTLSAVSGKTVTVDYSTADGTASAGKNYTATAGTLTFAPGQTLMQAVVPVIDDGINDPTETFSLTLATPTNATIARATATGTIFDDDPPPTISVADATATKEISGGEDFLVTLSAASGKTVTVNYSTADDTAAAGTDYTAVAGTLTFDPGQTSLEVQVPVIDNTLIEPTEIFSLLLATPVNATLSGGGATATGTILDNQPPVAVSIADAQVTASASGTTDLQFVVTLAQPSGRQVVLGYSTLDGTALAGTDYTVVSGTLTFNADGPLTQTVNVPVNPETAFAQDKTLTLNFAVIANATLADDSATGTIINDISPVVTVQPVSGGAEAGPVPAVFDVQRTGATDQPLTVNYSLSGPGAPPGDALPLDASVVIPAGQDNTTVSFTPGQDLVYTPDWNLTLTIDPSSDYSVGAQSSASAVIHDDDGKLVAFSHGHPAQYIDSQGDQVTLNLTGPGTGQLLISALGPGDAIEVDLTGTTKSSSLSMQVAGQHRPTTLGDVNVTGSLGALTAPLVDLVGDVSVSGTLRQLQADNVSGELTITVGAPQAAVDTLTLRLDEVTDLSVNSLTPIKLLQAASLIDTGGPVNQITAPSLATLSVAGDMSEGLVLTDGTRKVTLGSAKIGGSLTGGNWTIAGNVGLITVGSTAGGWRLQASGALTSLTAKQSVAGQIDAASIGNLVVAGDLSAQINLTAAAAKDSLTLLRVTGWIDGATITAASSIATLTAGGIRNSNVFIGLIPAFDDLPQSEGDFANRHASIGKLTILGFAGQTAPTFINSKIAAWSIGTATLREVQTDNGGVFFGITTHGFGHFSRITSSGVVKLSNLNEISAESLEPDHQGDYGLSLV